MRLGELLGRPVELAADVAAARAAVAALRPGGLVMLENLRFNAAETSKDDVQRGLFADQLAELADLYVADGFGAVHRKHASVYDVALRLPHAAGYLVQAEVAALSRLTADIRRPYVVVLGGAKVADKFDAIGSLITTADRILIGGAMAFPFLAARGGKVGASLLEADQVDAAGSYLDRAAPGQIELPSDVVAAAERAADAPHQVVAADAIPADLMGLDIGPESAARFAASIAAARTVFWNGPEGVFELAPYAGGTRAVAQAIIGSDAFTVVGGGDTGAAIRALGFSRRRVRLRLHRRRRQPGVHPGQDPARPGRAGRSMSGRVHLVLLRHGQSEWNAAGIFTGWENAHLTAVGEEEATRAGTLLAEHGVYPAFVHTSLQRRTIRTADLALAAADRDWIPVRRSWRLNGRHYGALQGRNKVQVRAEARRAAVHGVAPVLRRHAAAAQPGR